MDAEDSSGDAEGMNSDDTRGKLSEGCSTKLPLLAEVMKSEKIRLLATVPVMTSLLPNLMTSDRTKLLATVPVMTSLLPKLMTSDRTRLLATVPVMTSLLPKLMTSDRTRLLATVPVMTSLLDEVMRSDMTTLLSTVHVMTSLLGENDDTGDERSTDSIVPGLGGKLAETSVAEISLPLLAALVAVS